MSRRYFKSVTYFDRILVVMSLEEARPNMEKDSGKNFIFTTVCPGPNESQSDVLLMSERGKNVSVWTVFSFFSFIRPFCCSFVSLLFDLVCPKECSLSLFLSFSFVRQVARAEKKATFTSLKGKEKVKY